MDEGVGPVSAGRGETALSLKDDCLTWGEVEDEVVVLDRRTWTYMGINGSGAVLWKEIAQGATVPRLTECLCREYSIDAEAAARDVDAFVSMLKTHDLLSVDGGR